MSWNNDPEGPIGGPRILTVEIPTLEYHGPPARGPFSNSIPNLPSTLPAPLMEDKF
jgi:hypothetical protein